MGGGYFIHTQTFEKVTKPFWFFENETGNAFYFVIIPYKYKSKISQSKISL